MLEAAGTGSRRIVEAIGENDDSTTVSRIRGLGTV